VNRSGLVRKCWIRRGTVRLVRRTPLRRYTPLGATAQPVPTNVRVALWARSDGVCEIGRPGCGRGASQAHHRLLRKAGGRCGPARLASDRLSNLLHVCGACHRWVHAHPAAAALAGWLLWERQVAPMEPLRYRTLVDPVYLDDAGGVHDYETAGT
jgi:hypothetical protein